MVVRGLYTGLFCFHPSPERAESSNMYFSLAHRGKSLIQIHITENACSCSGERQFQLGIPVHGFLPGAGQQGADLQLHPQSWQSFEQRNAVLLRVIDTWKYGSPCEGKRFQVWPMWHRLQIWKRLEDSTHWKNTQQSGSDLTAPKVARNQLRSYSEPLCLGRSPPSSMKLWPGTWIPPLCQSINVPLTCAVSFNAQKKQKKRGGIGNKCKRSTPTGSPIQGLFIVWTKFRLVWCHTNFSSK